MNSDQLPLRFYFDNMQVRVSAANFGRVPLHWRDVDFTPTFNRLYFIREGEGWIKIRDEEYYPGPGQMVIMPAGAPQSYSAISPNVFTKYWVHFTARVGEFDLFQLLEMPHQIRVSDIAAVEKRLDELIVCHRANGTLAPLRVKSILFELIAIFLETVGAKQIRINASSTLQKLNLVLHHIERHLSEQMTVEGLARLVHLHPNYFIQCFKSVLGMSPIHYVNKVRIDKAKLLLATSEKTVSEIAEELGMEPFYLSRLFKKYTGFTPSEYRATVGQ